MITERSKEGYLCIDHRESPGLNDNEMSFTAPDLPSNSGRGLLELSWVCCAHCQKGIVQNPLRTRLRAHCRKCDWYICDDCAIIETVGSVPHVPFQKVMDDVLTLEAKGLPIPIFQRGKWPLSGVSPNG